MYACICAEKGIMISGDCVVLLQCSPLLHTYMYITELPLYMYIRLDRPVFYFWLYDVFALAELYFIVVSAVTCYLPALSIVMVMSIMM